MDSLIDINIQHEFWPRHGPVVQMSELLRLEGGAAPLAFGPEVSVERYECQGH